MSRMKPFASALIDFFADDVRSIEVPQAGVRPDQLDDETRNELCRKLSRSFICIMLLSFLCLWQHISLAIARNIDELAGVSMPSKVTEMMTAASRAVVYPPLVC